MLVDYHVHSNTSVDATGTVSEICQKAVDMGFDEICVTNHQEWRSVLDKRYRYAMVDEGWRGLFDEVEAVRESFPGLAIKVGCEVGFYPGIFNEIKRFVGRFRFDYVIGSVHNLDGRFLDEYTIGSEAKRAAFFRRYYQAVLGLVEEGGFDCLAHIDMIARYHKEPPFTAYADLIGRIIHAMVRKGIGFELNTAGLKNLSRECHPPPRVLGMLNEAGVRTVTIGSDSHSVDTFGDGVEEGLKRLRKAGFRELCTFEARKATYHHLPDV